ncbi:unnamed protein product, partial [Rotaria magnacalcarata]
MASNFTLINNDEIYIITLHRTFKINVIHLVNDLNNRIDKCISTRVKDICIIVNSVFNTNYTETTINEIIIRLDNGEMNNLFHTYDVEHLVANYISSPVIVTEAALLCLKPFTNICINCKKCLKIKFNRSIDVYGIDEIIKAGVYTSFCKECHYA